MSSSTPEEKKGNSSTGDTDTSLEQKVEMAQKFDKEMKDYAKATVKEFLGIYGYEEDVDNISMEDSCSETPRCSATPNINNPISTSSETLATGTQSTSSVSPLPSNVDKDGAQPAGSYSISSSTTNGNADMTRFCMTMSIPRYGADSEQGFTTLRFWNCIMCSGPFVGCKPEIVQRIQYPHLFTHQPEWLSHAGICTRCQNALTMTSPKITIYAINEVPQYHHGYTAPPTSVPSVTVPPVLTAPQMCHGVPGQCNCAAGVHGQVPGISPIVYSGSLTQTPMNVPNVKTEPVAAGNEDGVSPQYARRTQYVFRPITCTQ